MRNEFRRFDADVLEDFPQLQALISRGLATCDDQCLRRSLGHPCGQPVQLHRRLLFAVADDPEQFTVM